MSTNPPGEEPPTDLVALITAKLAEMGPEFLIASELPRIWATGAQAFVSGDFSMVLFREQNVLGVTPGAEPLVALKNVASIILPTAILAEFHENLKPALEQWKAATAANATTAK